jgi:hypothetical protein
LPGRRFEGGPSKTLCRSIRYRSHLTYNRIRADKLISDKVVAVDTAVTIDPALSSFREALAQLYGLALDRVVLFVSLPLRTRSYLLMFG